MNRILCKTWALLLGTSLLHPLSGCSEVILMTPGLQGSANTPVSRVSTLPPGSQELGQLNVRGLLLSELPENSILTLTLLNAAGEEITQQKVSLKTFAEQGQNSLFQGLPLGKSILKVKIQNAQGDLLLNAETPLEITHQSQAHWTLENQEQTLKLTFGSAPLVSGSPSGFPPSDTLTPTPGSLPKPAPSQTEGPLSSGGGGTSTTQPQVQNIRTLNLEDDRFLLAWDKPTEGAQSFDIYLNGTLVQANHPFSSYDFKGLSPLTDYTVAVVPNLEKGKGAKTDFGVKTLAPGQSSSSSSSSGGGGGGGGGAGGGGGGPAANNPPSIQNLTPSRTTLTGHGFPVQLKVNASDDGGLTAGSYAWSCDECNDNGASFNSTQGDTVIWTAPTTPGTYTLRVKVSDGVNSPVEQTQTITVNASTSTVTFTGEQN